MTIVPKERKLYLFGGYGFEAYNRLECLNLDTWRWQEEDPVEGAGDGCAPIRMFGHSLTYCAAQAILILFGGEQKLGIVRGRDRTCLFDLYFYSLKKHVWQLIDQQPREIPARRNHIALLVD
jgi:hypothetical protein